MEIDPSAPLAQNLVAHIPINEGSGRIVSSVGGRFRGSIVDNGVLNNPGPHCWRPGRTGFGFTNNALGGGGSSPGISFPLHPTSAGSPYRELQITPNLSCGIWLCPVTTLTPGYKTFFSSRCDTNGALPCNYEISTDTTTGGLLYYDGTTISISSFVPPLNTWTFAFATQQGTRMRLYANARLILEATLSKEPTIQSNMHLDIGWNGTNGYPNQCLSIIEHFYLYNRALSHGEVAELYANPWATCKTTNKRHWNISGSGALPPAVSPTPVYYMHRTVQGMS